MSDKPKESKKTPSSIVHYSCMFHKRINDIRRCATELIPMYTEKDKEEYTWFNKEKQSLKDQFNSCDNKEHHMDLFSAYKDLTLYNTPHNYSTILSKSLFLNLFSEFDSFLKALLEYVYKKNINLLLGSSKHLASSGNGDNSCNRGKTYFIHDIIGFKTIESIKNEYLRDVIDKFGHKSYVEQIEVFGRINNIELNKFKNWEKFIEICERRNIVKHCSSKATQKYINKCSKLKDFDKNTKINTYLGVDYYYLINAINIIEEVGIKLLHTTWRIQYKSNKKLIDECNIELRAYSYDLLMEKNWSLVITLDELLSSLKATLDSQAELIIRVNYCIALKELNMQSELEDCLESIDEKVVKKEFALAKYVLINEWDKVYSLMNDLGRNSEYFSKKEYLKAPLFRDIREEDKFKKTHEDIFGAIDASELDESNDEEHATIQNTINEQQSFFNQCDLL